MKINLSLTEHTNKRGDLTINFGRLNGELIGSFEPKISMTCLPIWWGVC